MSYERELYHLIPRLIRGKAPHVVNVGAAEGYYAVGLLTLRTDLRVTAFERSNRSRELLHSLATLNGVRKRLDIRGECRLPDLQQMLRMGSSRILIDVEGAERHLLDPSQVPELANASILVEMHEFEEPGETAEIVERFQGTHLITRIPSKERSPKDLPQVAGMTSRERLLAAFERSAEDQEWFWMVPR